MPHRQHAIIAIDREEAFAAKINAISIPRTRTLGADGGGQSQLARPEAAGEIVQVCLHLVAARSSLQHGKIH